VESNGDSSAENNGRGNLASARDHNRQGDSGRNGLSDGEGNGENDLEDNLDNKRESHGGGGGGDFR